MFGWLWDWLKGWLFIAVAAYVAALVFGVPHVLFEYTERVRGHKIACTYYGPFGKVRGLAGRDLPGNCPYIALLPLKEDWAAWPERQLEDLTDRASDQWEELKNRLGQWTGELWGWAVMIGGAALAVALGRFYWRRRSRPRVGGRAGSWRQKPHGGPDRRAEEPRGQEQAEALRREREALERERRERERLERQAREEQERRREDAQRQSGSGSKARTTNTARRCGCSGFRKATPSANCGPNTGRCQSSSIPTRAEQTGFSRGCKRRS